MRPTRPRIGVNLKTINKQAPQRVVEQLRREDELNRAIIETADCLIIVLDVFGHIVRFNRACRDLTCYAEEEVLGRNFLELLIPGPEQSGVAGAFRELTDGRFSNRYENSWLTRDGRKRRILWSNTSLLDYSGQVEYVVATGIDITDLRQAQELAETERERLAVSLSSIGDAVIATDPGGRVTLMNPAAEALTGWQASEAVGRSLAEVFHILDENSREPVEDPVERVTQQGIVVGLGNHTVLVRRDGYELAIEDSAAPIRNRSGEITGVIIVFRDVSEKRQQQKALAESEKRFRLLAHNAQDVIYRIALVPERKFEFVSPSVTRIIGYTPEEHYQDPDLAFKLVHPDDLSQLLHLASGDIDWGKPVVVRWMKKDGTVIWTEQQNTPVFDENGRLVAMEGMSRAALYP